MEEQSNKKDIKDIISTLTRPVSITEGNRNLNQPETAKKQQKSTFFTIFNRDKNDMLYKNFKLEEIKDSSTQTSKTIIELAQFEADGDISPDSLSTYSLENENLNKTFDSIVNSEYTTCSKDLPYENEINSPVEPLELNLTETETCKSQSLIETFLKKPKAKDYRKYLLLSKKKKDLKSQSCVETYSVFDSNCYNKNNHKNYNQNYSQNYNKNFNQNYNQYYNEQFKFPKNGEPSSDGEKSFMMPTLSSEKKNLLPEVKLTTTLLSPIRRGRSSSPKPKEKSKNKIKIPYIDQSETDFSIKNEPRKLFMKNLTKKEIPTPKPPNTFSKDMLRIDEMSLILVPTENNSAICLSDPNRATESTINTAITKMQDKEWNIALRGLAEVTELCKTTESTLMMPYMITINQKLISLLKSPRSHVCRTACQAAGHLFESMKDTRGPEFNDIVDLLLSKTADANKFIRKDANLALDCMVTHIGTSQAVKALCLKGPTHKNNLVRSATVRLLICAVVIAGPNVILNPNNNEATRKRIFTNLVKFLEDKNPDTRKYGERLYKVLSKERFFDKYLKKYIEKDDLSRMKKTLKTISKIQQ